MAGFSILMLPLDVANGTTGGFPMAQLWLAVYIVIAAMVVIIIPFAIFYYESEEVDDTGCVFYHLFLCPGLFDRSLFLWPNK